jgi:IS5 family transposase
MVMEVVTSLPDDDYTDNPDADAGNQPSIDDFAMPADWQEGRPSGMLTIDAFCTPADRTWPADLKLLNETHESIERIIDDLCKQRSDLRKRCLLNDRGRARANFQIVAKQNKSRRCRLIIVIRSQLGYLQRSLETIDALIASGPMPSGNTVNNWLEYG